MVAIAYFSASDNADAYQAELTRLLPGCSFRRWPDIGDPAEVNYALVWKPPIGFFPALPHLKAVFSLGAGVDHLLTHPELPNDALIVRLVDAGMAPQMAEYALYAALHYHRDMDRYAADQAAGLWQPYPAVATADRRIGILGLGALGSEVGSRLAALGFDVAGWTRSPRDVPGLESFHGADGLEALLARSDILIILLPLTSETRGLLTEEKLRRLPQGAAVVNLARGAILPEAGLLAVLKDGHLRGAFLDVFDTEPLPADHPYRQHPNIRITPHIAAQTLVGPAAAQVAASIRRLEANMPIPGVVARQEGY